MSKDKITQCFEYKEVRTPADVSLTEDKLNELGKDGWELITIDNGIYIFKRMFAEVVIKKKS